MTDPDLGIDGDVYVFPHYLAATTGIGDPALEPLMQLGWEPTHDDLGNAYLNAPTTRSVSASPVRARHTAAAPGAHTPRRPPHLAETASRADHAQCPALEHHDASFGGLARGSLQPTPLTCQIPLCL